MRNAWTKADLHVHTTCSDGHASVREVVEYAARQPDLPVIAITDHNTIEGALQARTLARKYGIEVIVGEEVSTADGELLALFIEQRLPPGRPAAETIAAAHKQGGLCVAAHPYDRMVPSMGRRNLRERCSGPNPEWRLDAIEVFNAGQLLPGDNGQAEKAAGALGLPGCGGSDSHHLATIATGYTLFPGRSAADLRSAIEQGQTYAAGHHWGLIRTVGVAALIARRKTASSTDPSLGVLSWLACARACEWSIMCPRSRSAWLTPRQATGAMIGRR